MPCRVARYANALRGPQWTTRAVPKEQHVTPIVGRRRNLLSAAKALHVCIPSGTKLFPSRPSRPFCPSRRPITIVLAYPIWQLRHHATSLKGTHKQLWSSSFSRQSRNVSRDNFLVVVGTSQDTISLGISRILIKMVGTAGDTADPEILGSCVSRT